MEYYYNSSSGGCLLCSSELLYLGNNTRGGGGGDTGVSLKNLFQYLNIEVSKVVRAVESDPLGDGNDDDSAAAAGDGVEEVIAGRLCEGCSSLANLFGGFYRDFEKVRLQLTACVQLLNDRVRNNSPGTTGTRSVSTPTPSADVSGVVDAVGLKAEILKQCESKLKSRPKVELVRVLEEGMTRITEDFRFGGIPIPPSEKETENGFLFSGSAFKKEEVEEEDDDVVVLEDEQEMDACQWENNNGSFYYEPTTTTPKFGLEGSCRRPPEPVSSAGLVSVHQKKSYPTRPTSSNGAVSQSGGSGGGGGQGGGSISIDDIEFATNRAFYNHSADRPPFSYKYLIRQAILESPGGQLAQSEIVTWFTTNFSHFRSPPRGMGYLKRTINSILYLHKECFVHVGGFGEGTLWILTS